MSISKISFTSNSNLLNNIYNNPSAHTRTPELPNDEVLIKKKADRKWFIGITAAISIIGLGILGRLGKLGASIQKLLGGVKEASASSNFMNFESKQKLLPMSNKPSSTIEILEAEVVDTTNLSCRSKLRLKPIIEDAEYVDL